MYITTDGQTDGRTGGRMQLDPSSTITIVQIQILTKRAFCHVMSTDIEISVVANLSDTIMALY